MNLTEKLLQIDRAKFTERETKEITSKTLKKIAGDGKITIKQLSGRRINEIPAMMFDGKGNRDMEKTYDMMLMYCMEGIAEPNMKDKQLMEHFGVATPKDLCELLLGAEVPSIAAEIMALSGITDDAEKEIKN